MNNGAFGENFPYSNFHDLNMDWIIKIAKDFLDQYTHIQEVIANGEESLQNLTTSGLTQLQEKADALEALLQQWYDTHSEDIANELANALQDIATTLTNTINSFNNSADAKSRAILDSWPSDYSKLVTLTNTLNKALTREIFNMFDQHGILTNNTTWNKATIKNIQLSNNYQVTGLVPNAFCFQPLSASKISFKMPHQAVEYFVLSITNINGYTGALTLALTGSNFGKIVAIVDGTSNFDGDGIVRLSNVTKAKVSARGSIITVEYIGGTSYRISVKTTDGVTSSDTIDIGNIVRNPKPIKVGFDLPMTGLMVFSTNTIEFQIIEPNNVLTSANKNTNLYLAPSIVPFSSDDLINNDNISLTRIDDEIRCAFINTPETVHFGYATFNSMCVNFRGKTNFEYFVLSTATVAGYKFCIAISLTNNYFGRLWGFNNNGTAFTMDSTQRLPGMTYSPNNKYSVSYIGEGVYKIGVNNEVTEVDISNVIINVGTHNVGFETPALGIVTASTQPYTSIELLTSTSNANSEWYNRRWFAFGDSITDMGYYIPEVNALLGTKSTKYGHNGYTYTELARVYTEMIGGNTPDLITIFAGTNDFGHSNPVETMANSIRTILNGLYTKYPDAQIVIITPLQRNFNATDTSETSGLGPNSLGKYLIDYVNKIKEIAEEYGTPCIDLYSMGGINIVNANSKTIDGLHPNNAYGKNIGFIIGKYIQNLLPF